MRVLIAPSAFTGTLSAPLAAEAMAAGWRDIVPTDEVQLLPVAAGGPGLVDVLAFDLGGSLVAAEVTGPDGIGRVPAAVLLLGEQAFIEAAQVCGAAVAGLSGTPSTAPTATSPRTTRGVGELVRLAVAAGARTVVVGLGGCVVADAGAGFVHGLAGMPDPGESGDSAALPTTDLAVTVAAAVDALDGALLVGIGAGTDALPADAPGRPFADAVTAALGSRAPAEDVPDHPELHDLPNTVPAASSLPGADLPGAGRPPRPRLLPLAGQRIARPLPARAGAGDGAGLGFAVLAVGGHHRDGIDEVLAATGFAGALAGADLVLAGEGSFDHLSRRGSAVGGVAAAAERVGVPCVVLAGRTTLGSRETRAIGVGSAYGIEDLAGWRGRGPADNLRLLSARAARTWGRR